MECMYRKWNRICEVPTPIVTYSFPFQMAILDEISLGYKTQTWNNLQSKWRKKTWQEGRKPFSHQLVESSFLFQMTSPPCHISNGWTITGFGQSPFPYPDTICHFPNDPFPTMRLDWKGPGSVWAHGLKMLSSKFLQKVFFTVQSVLVHSCFYEV